MDRKRKPLSIQLTGDTLSQARGIGWILLAEKAQGVEGLRPQIGFNSALFHGCDQGFSIQSIRQDDHECLPCVAWYGFGHGEFHPVQLAEILCSNAAAMLNP